MIAPGPAFSVSMVFLLASSMLTVPPLLLLAVPAWPTAVLIGVFVLFGASAPPAEAHEPPPIQKPAALQPGDTIMFVAPAGELIEDRVMLAKQRLEARGFRVIVPDDLFRVHGYLAGTDQRRADELMAAFTNPDVDAVFPGTGGYGTTRILPLLDFDAIAANPKVFIGFSDITALHLAIHQRTGLVTFHSPNPQWGLGSDDGLHPLAEKYWWRALLASSYEQAGDQGWRFAFDGYDDVGGVVPLTSGVGRGRLIGGNLSLVAALMGTPDEPQTDGKVLFLEDVGEAPYRVDRMLRQLDAGGKLDDLAGALLGGFTFRRNDKPLPEGAWTVEDVLRQYFEGRDYPVLMRVPFGHLRANTTLPVGALAEVTADAGSGAASVRLLEDPVILPE
ncbi:MAG: LD-carboxypeptidase [Planctomycetota bacterium]